MLCLSLTATKDLLHILIGAPRPLPQVAVIQVKEKFCPSVLLGYIFHPIGSDTGLEVVMGKRSLCFLLVLALSTVGPALSSQSPVLAFVSYSPKSGALLLPSMPDVGEGGTEEVP